MACYFFPRPATCYCPGCRDGFKQSTGLAIPYHEKLQDYTPAEQETVRRYHAWYQDRQTNLDLLADVIRSVVLWAAGDPPPYTLEAPERLLANMTVAGDTYVLHLANWTGNKLEQPGLNDYYLGPIENVRVKIRKPPRRKLTEPRLLVDSVFDHRDLGDQFEIHLPRIDAYQAIRFRCAK